MVRFDIEIDQNRKIILSFVVVITIRFNRKRARPDAIHEDLLSSFITPEISANEMGFRFVIIIDLIDSIIFFCFFDSDESYRENVLEKQADLIRYLHERNEHLSRLVLSMKRQVDVQNPPTNLI